MDTLVKMGALQHALAIGDDGPDLAMQKRLQELATNEKFEVLQKLLHERNVSGSNVHIALETLKIYIQDYSPLRDQAFLGVRHIHEPTPSEIENASTAVVAGPDQVVKVLSYIADNI